MALVENLPVGDRVAQWNVWTTTARVVVTDPAGRDEAADLVRAEIAAVDEAASRFRPDSEVRRIVAVSGGPVRISPRLAELVAAALHAARDTDGDVDPTVGYAMRAIGYTDAVPARVGRLSVWPAADWRDIALDGTTLTVPAGVLLDLGATAKAWCADRAAALVAARLGLGVLVALGGDIATAGPAPAWSVRVQDGPAEPADTVALPAGAALATSSTIARAWPSADGLLHHILDPRTRRPAPNVWRTVSVAAGSCVRANTLTTAAIVRGPAAPGWLDGLGVPARLVAADGTVVTLGAWPEEETP